MFYPLHAEITHVLCVYNNINTNVKTNIKIIIKKGKNRCKQQIFIKKSKKRIKHTINQTTLEIHTFDSMYI